MAGLPGQGFNPGTAAAPSSQVEISVSCRNLKDKDAFSKSDPVCVLFTWDIRGKTFHEFGRTEMIKDSLHPDFVKKFVMSYFFEESQKLKFEIYDVDSPSSRLTSHDFLGRMECTVGEIVGCGSGRLEKQLIGVSKGSNITVRAEEISSCREAVTMQMRATGLDKKDLFGKSDPFLIFYKANDDRSYTVVHKTEVIKNTLNPTWAPMKLPLRTLCNGDKTRTIKIECFDWDSDGSHDLIGEFTTTMEELIKAPQANRMFEVINPKKKAKKRNYKHSGELMVMSCKVEIVPTFLDFLQGGMEMNFTVAIDFTGSNGNPTQPTSLHYFHPNQPTQYAHAIQAVGEIIQDYDFDKMFPVLGFGAKLPDGNVHHEFACNFNPSNPYCSGIPGIMQAYYQALQQVQLYGPTNFSPVINHVSRFAAAKRDGSNYFVLLIITDGVITDMHNTINAIVNASSLPMSIIIVGVGMAEFDAMDVLDADGKRLGIDNRYAERDIVQFVPFRDFMSGKYSGDNSLMQAALAKSVLAEIPDQVVDFMKKRGIQPKPKRQVPPTKPPAPGQQSGAGVPGAPPQGGQQQGYPQGAPQQPGAPPQGGQQQPGYPAAGQPQQQYPQGGGAGQAPYPGAGVQAPYPAAGGQVPPYPQTGSQGSVRQGQGSAPYPTGAPQGGAAPYPTGAPNSAPYPQGGPVPASQGQPPYPTGGPGAAPYPQTTSQGQAPYPTGPNPYGQGQSQTGGPPGRPPPPKF